MATIGLLMNRSTKHGGDGGAKAAEGVLVLILEIQSAAIANGQFPVQLVKKQTKKQGHSCFVWVHCALCIVKCQVECVIVKVKWHIHIWILPGCLPCVVLLRGEVACGIMHYAFMLVPPRYRYPVSV